jgi:flavin-dependent dehydrogenase
MTARHDLLIAGASFAGVACAVSAARAGARVLLVERKRDPGERLHTTGIVVKEAIGAIDAIAPMPASIVRPIAGVRLHAPGGGSGARDSPGYFLPTDTPALMRWLGNARDAGVELARRSWATRSGSGGWRTPAGRATSFVVGDLAGDGSA